ncbi:putative membrane protein (plasmid) [Caballeronia cordobensis]|nr:putative membrane protein [Burkholderia sp. RPE67]
MLFQGDITIEIPEDADREKLKDLSAQEIVLAEELQRSGEWRHIWRIVGKWANLSIFDVPDASRLHEILTSPAIVSVYEHPRNATLQASRGDLREIIPPVCHMSVRPVDSDFPQIYAACIIGRSRPGGKILHAPSW